MKSAAETGAPSGSLLIGICECNRGMVIRVAENQYPCYNPLYECRHEIEDCFNLHNLKVLHDH